MDYFRNHILIIALVIFFNNKESQGISLAGDNRTGAGEGDDEVININLEEINPNIAKIVFVATNTQESEFIVQDVLGNNITEYFEIRKLIELNAVMICSLKPYSYGQVFLKLKKSL